jgi:hypothetical protein
MGSVFLRKVKDECFKRRNGFGDCAVSLMTSLIRGARRPGDYFACSDPFKGFMNEARARLDASLSSSDSSPDNSIGNARHFFNGPILANDHTRHELSVSDEYSCAFDRIDGQWQTWPKSNTKQILQSNTDASYSPSKTGKLRTRLNA